MSNFTYYDLGNRQAGEIVEFTLSGNSANVRLMDSSNYHSFKSGRAHRYVGGRATKSPVRLQVPASGHWYATVDLIGLGGRVSSSVRVLPTALPALREYSEPSLSSVPSLLHGRSPSFESLDDREFDVFISHASEDKDEIVRPLANALKAAGLRVWYDEFELKIGDSLRRKIDMGLSKSKFGVVVLSQSFLGKGWTNYELDGLVTKANSGEQILLPIWHKISKQEVMNYSPSLADKLARNTGSHTVQEIAAEIAEVIMQEPNDESW